MKTYLSGGANSLRVFFSLLTALTIPLFASGQAPAIGWAVKAGGAADDFSRGLAADAEGNCYVTGSFSGTAAFGSTNLTSAGAYDIFLAKYNNLGALQWVRQAGSDSSETEEGRGVALDKSGHVYVTGGFAGTANFGVTNLVSAGGLDIFLAKYTVSGDLLWVRSAGGSNDFEYGLGVAIDPAENVFVTGQFQGAAVFGATNLTGRGGLDIFLAKHDGEGEVLWVTQAGGATADIGRSVAVDGAGSSYIAGWISGAATFGANTILPGAGSTDAFAAKYDSQGQLRWIATVASNLGDLGYGFALDAATNGYLLAWTDQPNGSQLGLYKFDSNGGSQWARAVRVNSDNNARGSLAVDAAGNSCFTSQFSGTANFDGQTFLSQGASDTVAAKYDAAGTLQWVKQITGTTAEEGRGIAYDAPGNVYLTGRFGGTMNFGAASLTTTGQGDMFLARLDGPPLLTITRAVNEVVLSWPAATSGFQLQSVGSLPAGSQWQNVTGSPALIGGRHFVTNTLTSSNAFFRLRKL